MVRRCNQVIMICFNRHDKPDFTTNESEKTDSEDRINYESDTREFGENIANGIYRFLSSRKSKNDYSVRVYQRNILMGLIKAFLYRNFLTLDMIFKPIIEDTKNKDYLDNNVFLLSDDNKIKYVDEFLDRLFQGSIVFDDINTTRFSDILRYTRYDFRDEVIDKVIELMFVQSKSIGQGTMDVGSSILRVLKSVSGYNNKPYIDKWIKLIPEKRIQYIVQYKIQELEFMLDSKRYADLEKIVESLQMYNDTRDNEKIISHIVSSGFYLPNLSSDITLAEWSYAHSIARYSREVNKSNEFFDYAISECTKYPSNWTILERYDALIRSNIDSEYNLEKQVRSRLTS